MITINNGFRSSTTKAAGTIFTVTIPGVVNPVDLGESDTFQADTYTSGGLIMDQVTSGVTVEMTSTADMKSVSITPGSYVNAAVTSYTFDVTATVPVTESHYLVIQFPAEIELPTKQSTLDCSSDDTSIISSVTCTFNSFLSNSIKASFDLKSSVS